MSPSCAHRQFSLAAWVHDKHYPDSDRLVIVEPHERNDPWVAVLDGQYLQVLPRPRISRYLLVAYGVRTVS